MDEKKAIRLAKVILVSRDQTDVNKAGAELARMVLAGASRTESPSLREFSFDLPDDLVGSPAPGGDDDEYIELPKGSDC